MAMSVSVSHRNSIAINSVREPRLTNARRSSSARRESSILDYDLSKLQHSKDQRYSYESSEGSIIIPVPAEMGKRRTGRRVEFNFDKYPALTRTSSSQQSGSSDETIMIGNVLVEEVKKSLKEKDNEFEEFTSFLQNEEFTASGSSLSIGQSEQREQQDSLFNELQVPVPCTFALEGKMHMLSSTQTDFYIVMSKKGLDSRKPSMGGSETYIVADDIWPWPWLNSEIRAKAMFKSKGFNKVTFSHQASLPFMPLPSLPFSFNTYLKSVKPCVNAKIYSATFKAVKDFAEKDANLYHDCLIKTVELTKSSWIREFLPNYSNCYSRQEAPMLNTAIVAPFMYDLWPEKAETQTGRAAILVEVAVEFWQLLRDERLLPVSISNDGKPSCMHDFRKLFSSVKLPGIPRDEIFHCFTTDSQAITPRHIIIFYKSQIFTLEVLSPNYTRVSSEEIKRCLEYIITSVDEEVFEPASGVGILTSLNRNAWSELRIHLIELATDNQESLSEIEHAMFVLCLDHISECTTDRLLRDAVFGNACNRWYDKSLNFNVTRNGLITVNSNKSILEGSTVACLLKYIQLRIMEDAEKWDDDVLMSISTSAMDLSRPTSKMDDMLTKITSRVSLMADMALEGKHFKTIRAPTDSETSVPGDLKLLIFKLDDELKSAIEEAKINFIDMSLSLRTAVCYFRDYEKDLFGAKAVNTDAFANLVLQLTFFRMYYRQASVGSRVSLRRFHYGRYEILRSATSEGVDWCKAMLDAESTLENRVSLFMKALKKLVGLLKSALNGRSCENHLAALRVIAEDIYGTTPQLFEDDGFQAAGGFGHFDIYAECLGNGCTSCPVVWPTSPAGYGAGYFIAQSNIVFNITSWKDEKRTSAELFACGISYSLKAMHDILNSL